MNTRRWLRASLLLALTSCKALEAFVVTIADYEYNGTESVSLMERSATEPSVTCRLFCGQEHVYASFPAPNFMILPESEKTFWCVLQELPREVRVLEIVLPQDETARACFIAWVEKVVWEDLLKDFPLLHQVTWDAHCWLRNLEKDTSHREEACDSLLW